MDSSCVVFLYSWRYCFLLCKNHFCRVLCGLAGAEAEADMETGVEAETGLETETEKGLEAEVGVEVEMEAGVEAETEAGVEAETEVEVEAETEVEAERKRKRDGTERRKKKGRNRRMSVKQPEASVAIQVLPDVEGEDVIRVVDEVIEYIKSFGLNTYVGPFETTIEGDYEQLMEIVKGCQLICIKEGAPSVKSYVKIFFNPKAGVWTIDKKISKHHQ